LSQPITLKKIDFQPCFRNKITHFQNWLLAFHEAARGKRSKPSVANFEFNLEENLLGLQKELLDGEHI